MGPGNALSGTGKELGGESNGNAKVREESCARIWMAQAAAPKPRSVRVGITIDRDDLAMSDFNQVVDGCVLTKWPVYNALTHNKAFPYYVNMNVTLSLNDDPVRKVRKLAVERDTTLTGLLREYLEKLAAEDDAFGRKQREREALEQSFKDLEFWVGKHDGKRSELYDRD